MMDGFDLQAALKQMMSAPVRRVASADQLFAPLERFGVSLPKQESEPERGAPPSSMLRGLVPQAISGVVSPIMSNALARLTGAGDEQPTASFSPVQESARGSFALPQEYVPPPPGRGGTSEYAPLADRIAQEAGVDTGLVRAIIAQESNWNPQAVSPVGAQGLMQLMPPTAQRLGVSDSFDPEQNIRGGVAFLKWLLDKYGGDETLALAAYNAGPAAVDRYGGIPPYEETQRYVASVRGMMRRP